MIFPPLYRELLPNAIASNKLIKRNVIKVCVCVCMHHNLFIFIFFLHQKLIFGTLFLHQSINHLFSLVRLPLLLSLFLSCLLRISVSPLSHHSEQIAADISSTHARIFTPEREKENLCVCVCLSAFYKWHHWRVIIIIRLIFFEGVCHMSRVTKFVMNISNFIAKVSRKIETLCRKIIFQTLNYDFITIALHS